MNPLLLAATVVLLLPVLLAVPAYGEANSPDTDWLKAARYGVFMHFLPDDPQGLERVKEFDVQALARQLESVGAKYFVITLGQNSGYLNSPNATYDRYTGYAPGERCSTRDLPMDLYAALKSRGIRLMLYLPCQVPNQDARAQRVFGLRDGPQDQPLDLEFARKWAAVIQEWSDRYGDRVSGWWFDGGYEHIHFDEAIAAVYARAAKHGNPHAIVTFNPGVRVIRWTRAEDYTAGELNEPFGMTPSSRWLDGSQWHALTFIGSHWSARDTRYPATEWASWVKRVTEAGGAVTLDMGPNWDPNAGPIGSLAEAQIEQVRAVKAAVRGAGNDLVMRSGLGMALRREPGALHVPAYTAYVEPDAEAMPVSEQTGVTDWHDAREKVAWYGEIRSPGRLEAAVVLRLPEGAVSRLRLSIGGTAHTAEAHGAGAQPVTVPFGAYAVGSAGYVRIVLEGLERTGPTFGDLAELQLDGPAARAAHFNLTERRNAASVHLRFPLPPDTRAAWFYDEVTVRADPLWSYYMACGFSRGYFGIQVNSPTERRIIFSVWDSGNEATDRNRVSAENRVQLVAKGSGVVASDFGNEGTGGHSHLVYPWRKGHTYRFLVTAEPGGASTLYSGWFFFPERKQWGLIASFRAPKDGGYLRGLYAFNEDFGGANGELRRLAEFGNQWVRTADGAWRELTTAGFSHDPHGRENRLDYGAGVVHGRFYLSNGGFVAEPVHYGDQFHRPATGKPPLGIVLPLPSAGPVAPGGDVRGAD